MVDGIVSKTPSAWENGAAWGRAGGRDWHPDSASSGHDEIFTAGNDAAGIAAAVAFARDAMQASIRDAVEGERPGGDRRAVLWVQDRAAMRLSGRPYYHGLSAPLRDCIVHVAAQTAADMLFALEEGLRCHDLACVIGELAGNPRALSFTASRRLSLMAERYGVPLYLVRLDAQRDLSSARMRWDVRSSLSLPARWDTRAPGPPGWQAGLFRARGYRTGEWILRDDGTCLVARRAIPAGQPDPAPHSGDLAGGAGDRTMAAF